MKQNSSLKHFYKSSIFLLISVLIVHFTFSNLFLHAHVLPDGRVVVHSHYLQHNNDKKGNQTNHTHNNLEYLFYYLTTNPKCLLFYILFFILIFKVLYNSQLFYNKKIYHKQFIYTNHSLRAPPFNISF